MNSSYTTGDSRSGRVAVGSAADTSAGACGASSSSSSSGRSSSSISRSAPAACSACTKTLGGARLFESSGGSAHSSNVQRAINLWTDSRTFLTARSRVCRGFGSSRARCLLLPSSHATHPLKQKSQQDLTSLSSFGEVSDKFSNRLTHLFYFS